MTAATYPIKISRLRRPETIPLGLKVSVGKSMRPAIQKIAQVLNPEKIVLVHGDCAEKFEQELKEDFGYDAIAPKIGDRVNLSE
jgi:hypothetical protein